MRWLLNTATNVPWPWTASLAKRKDMREISDREARELLGAPAQPKVSAPSVEDPLPGAEELPEDLTDPTATAERILGMTDKHELEAFGRANGIELDRRKSVKALQAELIDVLGLGG